MKTKTIRSVCILMLAAALCLFMAACGDKSESPDASPEPSSTPAPVTDVSTPGSGVIISESTETAAPTPVPTPEPSREPTTVKLQYDGSDVTELSFLSSAVFQLRAITNDGSTGGAWTSSDASSASVDENGVVTCWKGGSPKITYTVNGASASVQLTIAEPTVRIFFAGQVKTDVAISSMYGFEVPFTAVVTPEGSPVTWTSDDSSIASVNESGLVTAHKKGTTTVHASCGTAKASCIIRVLESPPSYLAPTPAPDDTTPRIIITYAGSPNTDFSMNVGSALDMDYVLYNIDPGAKVTWSIKDPSYASVDQNGVIVALKSTFGIEPNRNYTILTVTCGDYSCESLVFIRKEPNT